MKRRTFNDPDHAHFLTFTCFHRRQFLTDEFARSALAEAISTTRERHTFALWAYVFMPEHVHLLIHPQLVDYKIGAILPGAPDVCPDLGQEVKKSFGSA